MRGLDRASGQGDVALRFILEDEPGGIGGDDAVAAGQVDDLLPELFLLAIEADLIEEVADAARRPEARDEIVLLLPVHKSD